MKDKILEILKNANKSLDVFEIEQELGTNNLEELLNILHEMEKEATIYHTNKDKYMIFEDSHLKKGILHANKKGFGFVDIDGIEEDIYIKKENMNGALHGDSVIVEIISNKNIDRLEGRIVKVLEHKDDTYVGEFRMQNNVGTVILDDDKINLEIIIPKDKTLKAVDGHKVVVKLIKRLSNRKAEGEIIKIIGHKNDPGVDILSIAEKYHINSSFSEEVIEELKTIPDSVSGKEIEHRRDLRDQVIFTIDGDDTKDIDDAISIVKKENGDYILGVHIADVSYYVKEESPLDKEALERGTSVYLVDRVIPMLPHQLSNGICSLNPNVDRLAISCVMTFNQNGKMTDYEIFESVIRSRIQMTYNNVNKILEQNKIPSGYESYVNDLKTMEELAKILRKEKTKRGYIDFDIDEAKILVDDMGKPTDIVLRNRGTGENLIEDFMIAANECVAQHIYYMNLPFIYRIHDKPKEEKINSFLSFVSSLGYTLKGNIKNIKPTTIQKILNELKDKKEYKILSNLLLRCMQKAIYKPENIGHYGLASPCYTHFTSPIRRYPDTTVHRLLRTYLFNHDMKPSTLHKWQEKLIYIADWSSARERSADDCEREVEDMKMAEYMESHIGEEYEGMISSVMSFGLFVELPNMVEGLVPIREMDDYFVYDEEQMTLTGEKSKIRYKLGDKVLIKVIRASKETRNIDFEIIKKL